MDGRASDGMSEEPITPILKKVKAKRKDIRPKPHDNVT